MLGHLMPFKRTTNSFRLLLCGGAAVAALITGVPSVSAQPVSFLEPSSNWAVSRIAGNGQGESYCALARRFEKDMVITFARNGEDESSVAVDFQSRRLSREQSYYVSLKPGFGQNRSFNVQPVSDKAVVIRLGKDYAFYDALVRSGRLTIDFGENIYDFDMRDFAAGQQQMAGCLSALIQPAAGGQIQPRSASGGSSQSGDIEALKSEISSLKTMVAQQQQQAAFAQQAGEPKEEKSRSFFGGSDEDKIDRYKDEIKELKSENKRLESDLKKAAKDSGIMQATLDKLQGKLDKYLSSNSTLTERYDSMTGRYESLEARLEQAEEDNRKALAYTDDLQAKMAQLRAEKASLNDNLQEVNAKLLRKHEEEERLKSKLSVQVSEAENLKSALSQKNAAEKALKETAEEEFARLEREKKTAEALKNKTSASLQSEKQKYENLRVKYNELVARLEKSQEAQIAQKMEMGKAIAELAAMKQDNVNLQHALGKVQASNEAQRLQIDQLLIAQDENLKLRRDLDQMGREVELTRVHKQADAGRLTSVQQQVSELQARNVELQETLSIAQQQMADLKRRGELALSEERHQVAMLQQEKERLARDVAQAQEANIALELKLAEKGDQVARAMADQAPVVAELEREVAALKRDKATLSNSLKAVNDQLASSGRGGDRQSILSQRITAQDETIKTITQERDKLEDQLARALRSVAPAAGGESGVSDVAALEKKLDVLSKENARLIDVVSRSQNGNAQNIEFEERLGILQSELQRVRDERDSLKRKLSSADGSIAGADINILNTRLEDVVAERDRLAARLEAVENVSEKGGDVVAVLKKQLQELEADNMALREKMRDDNREALQQTRISDELQRTQALLARSEKMREELNEKLNAAMVSSSKAVVTEKVTTTPKVVDVPVPALPKVNTQSEISSPVPENVMSDERAMAETLASVSPAAGVDAPSGTAVFTTKGDLAAFIRKAGIDIKGDIKNKTENGGITSYNWETARAYGTAEQRVLADREAFLDYAQDYLTKTENRCGGEFAAVPEADKAVRGMRITTYEIACVGQDGQSASASIVFFSRDGYFTTIAHEASLDGMVELMDARDRIISLLSAS